MKNLGKKKRQLLKILQGVNKANVWYSTLYSLLGLIDS